VARYAQRLRQAQGLAPRQPPPAAHPLPVVAEPQQDLRNGRCDETQQEYNMLYIIPLEQQKMTDAGLLHPSIPAFCS
jgi:hypothetical protein